MWVQPRAAPTLKRKLPWWWIHLYTLQIHHKGPWENDGILGQLLWQQCVHSLQHLGRYYSECSGKLLLPTVHKLMRSGCWSPTFCTSLQRRPPKAVGRMRRAATQTRANRCVANDQQMVVLAGTGHLSITKPGWDCLVSLFSPSPWCPSSHAHTATRLSQTAAREHAYLRQSVFPPLVPQISSCGGFWSLQLSVLALIPCPSLSISRGNSGAQQHRIFISTLASCQGSATWSQGCICCRTDWSVEESSYGRDGSFCFPLCL